MGPAYTSCIYTTTDLQQDLAVLSKAAYQKALRGDPAGQHTASEIVTRVVPLLNSAFTLAPPKHQQYLAKPGARPYCSAAPLAVQLPPYETWRSAGDGTGASGANDGHRPKLGAAFWRKHGPSPSCVLKVTDEQIAWSPFDEDKAFAGTSTYGVPTFISTAQIAYGVPTFSTDVRFAGTTPTLRVWSDSTPGQK